MYNRTVSRAIEILKALSTHPEGLSHFEIMELLNIPQTSVYDILRTLVHHGMVIPVEGKTKKYILGLNAFIIGSSYLNKHNFVDIAKPILENIANKYEKNTHISIIDGNEMVYLYTYKPQGSLIAPPQVGERRDLHCTALGKVVLAFDDKINTNKVLNELEYKKYTERTITNKEELLKELYKCKKDGYCIDNRENDSVIYAVGAPLYDYSGNLVAAISLAGFYEDSVDFSYYGKIIAEAGEKISLKLGYFKK